MPDETGTEAAGFPPEPDLELPLNIPPASLPGPEPAWTCTRSELVGALTGRQDVLDAESVADAILSVLPRLLPDLPFGATGATKGCGCGPDRPCAAHADRSTTGPVRQLRDIAANDIGGNNPGLADVVNAVAGYLEQDMAGPEHPLPELALVRRDDLLVITHQRRHDAKEFGEAHDRLVAAAEVTP